MSAVMRTKIKQLTSDHIGQIITVKGWIRSVRSPKEFSFIAVNDGSTFGGLQIIADGGTQNYVSLLPDLTTGAAIAVTGQLVASKGAEQPFELKAATLELIGACPADTYPLQKKGHSFEFLRTIGHLRSRTNTIGAVTRVRNALAYATHTFFQERGFVYLNSPIVTSSDCEGAGQMFQVSTLSHDKPPRTATGGVDYAQDFFGEPTFLTVSGQLNAEIYALSHSDVYTFGPTFRAENSNTSRHLAEFWMIEPEMAFADLNDDMNVAESYVKYMLGHVLKTCGDDMKFFNQFIDKGLLSRLEHVLSTPFERISYTQAVNILLKAPKKFEYPVTWGCDLQSEHERYLAEEYFKKPMIVTGYPKDIKAFYMRMNDDEKTVAAMDVLVPGIGELIGGSQREERYDYLAKRMDEMKLDKEHYWWYMDLRRFGGVPHAGFGLGFERMVQFATGIENIREAIPFPRSPKNISF
jgi:asparaginyl-tRNA synthetase